MAPPCRLIHKLGAISSFPFEGALDTSLVSITGFLLFFLVACERDFGRDVEAADRIS